jgi:hypothetical protein
LLRREGVEDCGEDVESETGAVVWRRGDGSRDVLAEFGQENVGASRLVYEVHEEVVCGDEFWVAAKSELEECPIQ